MKNLGTLKLKSVLLAVLFAVTAVSISACSRGYDNGGVAERDNYPPVRRGSH